MLSNFVAPYDAHVIERLNGAGAVIAGQDEHGRVRHGLVERDLVLRPGAKPWDARAVPGGSSGGSAAAVAARLAPAATGTDTGGSIRQPAALSRRLRLEADVWRGVALRHDRVRFEPRSGRADGEDAPKTSRCC